MALTPEQIHAAADKIAEAGEKPTLAAVRKALGGGSFTTISEALKDWREAQTEEHELAAVEVPEAVSDRVQALQAQIWQLSMAEAEKRLQSEREALKTAQEKANADVIEAREAVTTLENEAQDAATTIKELEARLAESEAAKIQAEQAKAASEATAAAKIEGLEARLADAQKTIEALIAKIDKAPAKGDRGKDPDTKDMFS
jgi:chromosome segregation ATPase